MKCLFSVDVWPIVLSQFIHVFHVSRWCARWTNSVVTRQHYYILNESSTWLRLVESRVSNLNQTNHKSKFSFNSHSFLWYRVLHPFCASWVYVLHRCCIPSKRDCVFIYIFCVCFSIHSCIFCHINCYNAHALGQLFAFCIYDTFFLIFCCIKSLSLQHNVVASRDHGRRNVCAKIPIKCLRRVDKAMEGERDEREVGRRRGDRER